MAAVQCTLTSSHGPVEETFRLLSVDILHEVNRVPSAELRFIDGNAAKQRFELSEAEVFAPGAVVRVSLNYIGEEANDERDTLFEGVVVRHAIESGRDGSSLVVGLKDVAVKLTATRQSAVYTAMTDSDIFGQILTAAGFATDGVTPTEHVHPEMVHYDATPWDFLVLRAEAMGMLVAVHRGRISIGPMVPKEKPPVDVEIKYGIDAVYELELEASAESPHAAVASSAWDPQTNTLTPPVAGSTTALLATNLDPALVAAAAGRDQCALLHAVPVAPAELTAWANARLARSRLAMLRGRVAMKGTSAVKLLDTIHISGVGQRFFGEARVTAVRHRYDVSGWRTDLQIGLSPERLCQREDVAGVPAAGLLPPARGLQLGVVAAFAQDDGGLRVKVVLPGVDQRPSSAVWARLASPDAGMGRGYCFRPEIDDEVVVGFLQDDPRHPVILGALFGRRNAAPAAFGPPSADNLRKGIVTRQGTTIGFVDAAKPSVFIETPGQNRIVVDDAAGGISMRDQNGNTLRLDAGGITIDAGAGTVTIKGAQVNVS